VAPDLHRGDFDVDETAIACGTRLLLAATMKSLRDATRKEPGLSTTPGGEVT
jgi:hypothetical protein